MSSIEDLNAPRKPWMAAALSAVSTGLGHIYSGKIVKGLVLYCLGWLLVPLALFAALLPPFTIVLVVLMLGAVAVVGVYAYAVIDAYREASRHSAIYRVRDYNRSIVYALLAIVGLLYPLNIAWGVRTGAFEAFRVASSSMSPTVFDGDRVLANKMAYSHRPPRRGDLIVFRNPTDRNQVYINRVVALGGDTIALEDHRVIVNGRATGSSESRETIDGASYSISIGDPQGTVGDFAEVTVPAGACFVVGDSRDQSFDSRAFGGVPYGDVLGQVQYIFLPAQSWGRFGAIR